MKPGCQNRSLVRYSMFWFIDFGDASDVSNLLFQARGWIDLDSLWTNVGQIYSTTTCARTKIGLSDLGIVALSQSLCKLGHAQVPKPGIGRQADVRSILGVPQELPNPWWIVTGPLQLIQYLDIFALTPAAGLLLTIATCYPWEQLVEESWKNLISCQSRSNGEPAEPCGTLWNPAPVLPGSEPTNRERQRATEMPQFSLLRSIV